MVRTFNDRGSFLAKRAGLGRHARGARRRALDLVGQAAPRADGTPTPSPSQELTDMGGGATFYDVLVDIERA